jgi:hypothetical protein
MRSLQTGGPVDRGELIPLAQEIEELVPAGNLMGVIHRGMSQHIPGLAINRPLFT